MGLLTPKGKKGDKKNATPKANSQQSKFIPKSSGLTKGAAGVNKKSMNSGSQRGS